MFEPTLVARKITKRFGGVTALRDVSFDLAPGEIHALCGENGAGKSTLIKLLSGIHRHGSYEGELMVAGKAAAFRSTADAQRAGIAVIYQELALVPRMTVAENIFLGHEPRRWGLIDRARMFREASRLLERFQVKVDPGALCGDLGVGQRQLVEIVKALSKESGILILDEPSAALAEHEVVVLLDILRDLRSRGISCVYISHKLDEVFAIADRITVLRDGATISTRAVGETSKVEVIRQMVGREIEELFPRRRSATIDPGYNPMLRVEGLTVMEQGTGRGVLHDVSFSVAAGEVLGLGGLMGAGRTELLMHLFGVWGRRKAGQARIGERVLPVADPIAALKAGLVLVTEDRRRYGLTMEQSIAFNLSLSSLRKVSFGGVVQSSREHRRNAEMSRSLHVKAPGVESIVGQLSGGNQQKVVLGKALLTEPRVVFLDEPTRGIDVGAKIEIYEIINRLTDEGKAVVLVSSELPELIGISDRILMLHEGRIAGEFTEGNTTPERLLAAAMGQEAA
jgi:D-xylose transport system ATP-binding protein